MPRKSVLLAFILSFVFGGLGVFYSSIVGGIVMTLLEIVALLITIITFGFGAILLPIVHIVSIVWAIVAASNTNNQVIVIQQ